MKIKSTTAFRAYADARAKSATEQAAATARFMVKSVNKDGSISRMAPTRNAWKYDAFATAEDAAKAARPARGDEPRLALRGGRALTRATGADAGPRGRVMQPGVVPRAKGHGRARAPRGRGPSLCRQPASKCLKEHQESTSAGLARGRNGSLYVLTRRALRTTRHGGRR
ncbi:MAG: hypothetical protein KF901_19695 [Myxococcales bacterium]|nr:hypothetical protein [Myxococcales bacterium]